MKLKCLIIAVAMILSGIGNAKQKKRLSGKLQRSLSVAGLTTTTKASVEPVLLFPGPGNFG